MFFARLWLPAAALCFLAACSSGPRSAPAIGEAYAGPAALKLRREISPQSPDAATVAHGEKLEIVQRRRRFFKVRTSKGVEGWTDMRQLLSAAQMSDLNHLAEQAASLPSHGQASVYEAVNVHTEPNRQSPSFYQIKEKENFEVVEYVLAPRIPFKAKDILPPPPPRPRKPKKQDEDKNEGKIKRPPLPPAPKPPDNWLELSKSPVDEVKEEEEPEPPKPVPMDDWALVRLHNGRAGWLLARMLKMNIPDEVAQYSEGHRITSYFSTAQIRDDDGQIRHNWLWTTLNSGGVPYQFDSFRYFIWNRRHHRYETAYVERNLKGYFPVRIHPVQVTMNKKQESMPGFDLIMEDEDGQRYLRTYAYQIYLVRLISKTRLEMPKPSPTPAPEEVLRMAQSQVPAPAAEPKKLSARIKESLTSLKQRFSRKQ